MLLYNFPTLISTLKNTHVGRNAFGGDVEGKQVGLQGKALLVPAECIIFATGHNIIKCVKYTRSMP
jgi:hypothetical protein